MMYLYLYFDIFHFVTILLTLKFPSSAILFGVYGDHISDGSSRKLDKLSGCFR